jgi:glucose-6-phosphate 1-dehydrogenase
MSDVRSDALVFFGATSDLAYKKIIPALQGMAKRGHLEVPVIGVARASWGVNELRARESVDQHGGLDHKAFDTLCGILRHVGGDHDGLDGVSDLHLDVAVRIRQFRDVEVTRILS